MGRRAPALGDICPDTGRGRLSYPRAEYLFEQAPRSTDEGATAAAFLFDAGFVIGSDLLIDGGVVAAMNAGRLGPGR